MHLRSELCPPLVTHERVAQLRRTIEHITELLWRGEPAEATIAAFNADTGHTYTAEDFHTYLSARSAEEFAMEAARPAWPKVPDVTRDELVEVVRRIQAGGPDADFYLLVLETNVAYPQVSELVYWPPSELVDTEPEDIIDVALRYRPIAL